ncbi:alpha carbonic anhydrase [Trifolium repens]|nr:alpha carbonic anhydrase [Trifolium repens]KAK2452734.1 alpha carbonic anhydrase [Trifolium repens]
MGSKFDIEKFTGSNDFGLWKVKMKAVLVHNNCAEALKGAEMPASLSDAEKAVLNEKAVSCITLCLADKVLREVAKETNAADMWAKLESLYMTKSVAHKQFLKQKLYFYRMVESKSITEQLAEFNKIIDDLANIDVKLEDEDKALHLLCTLPKSYESFKDTMLYGKETPVTLEEVQSALRTKELTKFKDLKVEDGANALNVSGGKGGSRGKKAKSKVGDKWTCFHCQKKGHFKRDCPELKDKNGSAHVVDGSSGDENYETAEALVVSSWESEESKSLDSGGSHDVLELWDVGVVSDKVEWFCKLQGGVHRGSTEFETLVEEFHLKVEDFQLEVEASDSDTRGGETTLTLGYQEGDREESGSGAPKWYDCEDLVGYVPIEAEEVRNLLNNFREAIGNTDNRTWELVGLLEVVGHKESSLLELEQQPKIPRLVEDKQVFESTEGIPGFEEGVVELVGLSKRPMIVGCKRIFRRTGLITPGSEEVAVSLVGATKNPMVVGGKTFMRAEGIPRDEEVEVQLVILARVVGSKWKRSRFKWDLDLANDLE